jgi:DNA-binding response OmpR family regulator
VSTPRLLLVDDAASVLNVFREVLGHAGFEVDTARTATEAVAQLTTRAYAVIVADCVLSDLAPLDWVAAIRGAAPRTPLVLYSVTGVLQDLKGHARDWGAVATLEKPVKPAELVAAVRGAVAHLT